MSDNFETISPVEVPSLESMKQTSDAGNEGLGEGGKTKIKATSMEGASGEPMGNTMNKGVQTDYTPTAGSSGFNISPVTPELYGDPNHSAGEFPGK